MPSASGKVTAQQQTLRQVMIILALALGLLLAGVVLGAMAFSVAPIAGVDTQTHVAEAHTWRGGGNWVGGTQLLDAPYYVSGYHSDGSSEKIVAEAVVNRYQTSCINPGRAVYQFWFQSKSGAYPNTVTMTSLASDGHPWSAPSGDWVGIKEEEVRINAGGLSCPDHLAAPASITQIKGNFIGIVRVEFWVEWGDVLHNGFHDMAGDQAPVQPGWGLISIQNADSLIEVGETLKIHYDVGAACSVKTDSATKDSGCGWTLSVRNRDDGSTPTGWTDQTLGDYKEGTIEVTVTSSWFKLGTHNEYEVKLFNQLNLQDAKIFVTIDDRNLAPGVPKVTVITPPPYRQNDRVELKAESQPNGVTKAPIQEYHVIVRQGGRILLDTRANGSVATVTFAIADEQIDIQVEATAFDGSRTSGVSRQTMVVLDTDLESRHPSMGGSIPWGLVLLLGGIIAALIGLAVDAIPLYPRLGLIGAGIVMVLVGVFVVGIELPSFLPHFAVLLGG